MWETLSKILNIPLGLFTIYFYLENRKLKGFEVEKKLVMKKAELVKLENGYYQSLGGVASYCRIGLNIDIEKEEREFNYKKSCIEAEIKYLEKLKKYKWLFSK